MPRYHVNPATGNPGPCRAETAGGCPFGIADVSHRDSPEAVYTMMEKVYSDYLVPKPLHRSGPPNPNRLAAILAWTNPCIGTPRLRRPEGFSLSSGQRLSMS